MLIGELASAVDVPPATVRYYERRGLLAEPARAPNGYRHYDETAISRLRFIRSAQAAGLTLGEIGTVIELREQGATPCEHVGQLLDTKLGEVRERQRQLAALERELASLIARSRGLDPAECSPNDVCHILFDGAATG